MVGTDKSMELWWPPSRHLFVNYFHIIGFNLNGTSVTRLGDFMKVLGGQIF